ncbi:hypothetical protein GGI25_004546 [Coemansia spiralis]|uniref:Major facilitator superfamily (MFS) profile domain-containing protein n=2 Tax=Coemansia TaxID=4863 RepID=A0A9W8G6B3_9FUNG|nr:hypothetical protein EDC05_004384 [Coemansia umbellata]KAJ2620664.1 hypothetical protein GGI26_004826 [Coemansia sp. RSA 1358]KAJ2673799.1 hypothetical protein GGI25_004546 [Coemansia spiralis]
MTNGTEGNSKGQLQHDEPKRETPLPWGKLSVLLAVRLAEPINFTLVTPFIYEMVGGFDAVHDPKDISFYAGLLLTMYSVCKAATAMYWGTLSDRIGRRPVILLGLLGNLATSVLFGVSKSFKWALVVRSLNGLFTGNSAVIKSVVAEISDDTNRSRMMALLPLMWNLGSMLGGAIGGLSVDPVNKYPALFGNSKVFREYPYLLPCLIGSTTTVFGLVVGFFQLEETHFDRSTEYNRAMPNNENTPLLSEEASGSDSNNDETEKSSKWDILTPTVVRVLVTNTIMVLAISMHVQLYPIFVATSTEVGGLGMSSQSIGYTMAISGLAVIYLQLAFYPWLERKLGALSCYRHGLWLLALFSVAFPFLSVIAARMQKTPNLYLGFILKSSAVFSSNYFLFWLLLVVLLLIRTVGDILAFTSISMLVANIAPRKSDLGFMNGLQQQTMAIAHMIGPLISGYLWSWSIKHSFPYPLNSHFVWILGGISLGISWYMTRSIPDSVNVFASGSKSSSRKEPDNEAT